MRKINRFCIAIVTLACLFMLVGCDKLPGFGEDKSTSVSTQQGEPVKVDTSAQTPQLGVPEDQLSFGLTHTAPPDFQDDIPGSQEGADGVESAPQPIGDMYTEIDGYAYRLDPATMTPVGEPLDVITHEPVVLADVTGDTNDENQVQPEDTPGQAEEELSPSQETPTEATKYPNTGIFLEDD